MLTLTERADIDRLMASTEEMLRNRHDIARLREDLLELELTADRARNRIDKLMRRQLELAALVDKAVRP